MNELTLGIDTSCYTTSVALASAGRVVHSKRKLLSVPEGEKGLRQSDGVFQHVRALPALLEEMLSECPNVSIGSVCASDRPRDALDSYMPVFTAGASFARAIAAALNVPAYSTSHQQGHIRAAMQDSGIPCGPFVALHLSGGTTQTLLTDETLSVRDIGGSSDLNAGQLVDRAGVSMGLPFPSGRYLEELAVKGEARHMIPVSEKDLTCSFSGAENRVGQMLLSGMRKEDVAAEVYSFLARSVARLVCSACKTAGVNRALIAGGVASSNLLRNLLKMRVSKLNNEIRLYWGKPELSGDNACGVALIGAEMNERKVYGSDH
ncbi:MAG: hypothetical protein II912_06705 [Clostridia bacterium]|nr:hypothetical protein [Clostridia bacterium]